MQKSKNISKVKDYGLCCRCGLCAGGICPVEAISIVKSKGRDFIPKISEEKCINCGLCSKICPGLSQKVETLVENKKMDKQLGSFDSIYLGHSTNETIRKNSSSGGVVSSLLVYILKNKIVDKVVVLNLPDNSVEPEFLLTSNIKDILSSSKSKYLPASMDKILKIIIASKYKKFVVVGLPCYISGIRKATQFSSKLKQKKIICLGLFCGVRISWLGTKFWLDRFKVDEKNIKKIDYRAKSDKYWNKGGGGFLVETKDNKNYFVNKHKFIVVDYLFKPKRCNLCDDLTNEYADISFGDPSSKYRKETLIISRTNIGKDLLQGAKENNAISLKRISKVDAFKDHDTGLIRKKETIFCRIQIYKLFGEKTPNINYLKLKVDPLNYFGAFLSFLHSKNIHKKLYYSFWKNMPLVLVRFYIFILIIINTYSIKDILFRGVRLPFKILLKYIKNEKN